MSEGPCASNLLFGCGRVIKSDALRSLKFSHSTFQHHRPSTAHGGGIVVERVFRDAIDDARKAGWDQGVQDGDAEWVKKYDNMKLAAHKYRAKAKVGCPLSFVALQEPVCMAGLCCRCRCRCVGVWL